MNFFNSTEFWSAIFGALVGGFIALGAQMVAARAARKQREEERHRTDRSLAHSLLFKLMRIHGNLNSLHMHIENCFGIVIKKAEPWQAVFQMSLPQAELNFSGEEIGILLAHGDDDLFNSVFTLDTIYNGTLETVKVYNRLRDDLQSKFSPLEVRGDVISVTLDPAERLASKPRALEANGLLRDLRTNVEKDVHRSKKAIDLLHHLLKTEYGFKKRLVLRSGASVESLDGASK